MVLITACRSTSMRRLTPSSNHHETLLQLRPLTRGRGLLLNQLRPFGGARRCIISPVSGKTLRRSVTEISSRDFPLSTPSPIQLQLVSPSDHIAKRVLCTSRKDLIRRDEETRPSKHTANTRISAMSEGKSALFPFSIPPFSPDKHSPVLGLHIVLPRGVIETTSLELSRAPASTISARASTLVSGPCLLPKVPPASKTVTNSPSSALLLLLPQHFLNPEKVTCFALLAFCLQSYQRSRCLF